MTKPKLFIGSSSEGLEIAYAAQENLDKFFEVTVWDQGIFELSRYNLESLLSILEQCDYGLFIFTPDDACKIRDEEKKTVRDNVVFELGLFIGRFGRDKCFILCPKGPENLHIPTDIWGLKTAEYNSNRSDGNFNAALGPACNMIRKSIDRNSNLNSKQKKQMDWPTYNEAILLLKDKIDEKPGLGGFRPHLVIGVNQGGAIIGGFLYYHLHRSFLFVNIWTNFDDWTIHSQAAQARELSGIIDMLLTSIPGQPRILLVDDSLKTGISMSRALSLVKGAVKGKKEALIKTAAVVYRSDFHKEEENNPRPDYFIHEDYTHFPYAKV